jgi:hypothetical protein
MSVRKWKMTKEGDDQGIDFQLVLLLSLSPPLSWISHRSKLDNNRKPVG